MGVRPERHSREFPRRPSSERRYFLRELRDAGLPGIQPAFGGSQRAAVSTGFRAPRLAQRGFNTLGFVGGPAGLETTGFLPEGDPIACEDFDACSLGHETWLSLTAGSSVPSTPGWR